MWSSGDSRMTKLFKYVLLICVVTILFSILSFYEMFDEEKVPLENLKNKIAVVYAYPTFHDEVVSAGACMLHDLGYYVVVYIGNGVHVGDMLLPFSQRRKRNSENFYGQCVSQWVTISNHMKFVKHPDVMMFVTYPMMKKGMKVDNYAIKLLEKLHADKSKTPVILISHRSHEMLTNQLMTIEKYVPRDRLTFLFLGEHTAKSARRILESQVEYNGSWKSFIRDPDSFRIDHIFPVMPKEYVVEPDLSHYHFTSIIEHIWNILWNMAYATIDPSGHKSPASRSIASNSDPTLFTETCLARKQNYFSYAEDVENIVDKRMSWLFTAKSNQFAMLPSPECLAKKEEMSKKSNNNRNRRRKTSETKSAKSNSNNSSHDIICEPRLTYTGNFSVPAQWIVNHRFIQPSKSGALFAVQGNFGGKHSYRKDPRGMVTCLQRLESAMLTSVSVAKETLALKKSKKTRSISDSKSHANECRTFMRDSVLSTEDLKTIDKFYDEKYTKMYDINGNSHNPSLNYSKEWNSFLTSFGNVFSIPYLDSLSHSHTQSPKVSLDLIGHLDGELNIPEDSFVTGKVRFLSDLDSKSYYTAISRARFMVAAIKDKEYYTTRATSSVPAAMIAQVPLVTTGDFLQIYPCLRDQPLHRRLARETECEAVEAAAWVTEEDYDQLVHEIKMCSMRLWNEGKVTLTKIIEREAAK